jgi:hypothetical protein
MWLFNDIQSCFGDLQSIAKKNGFLISLYGSVLEQGKSQHDIDLIAVPYVTNKYEVLGLVDNFVDYFQGTILQTYEGLCGTSFVIRDQYNRIIDLQLRQIKEIIRYI